MVVHRLLTWLLLLNLNNLFVSESCMDAFYNLRVLEIEKLQIEKVYVSGYSPGGDGCKNWPLIYRMWIRQLGSNESIVNGSQVTRRFKARGLTICSVTRKQSPNVYKSCPKMISLEKWVILKTFQKLPKNVRDLDKLIFAEGFKKLPKVQ